GTLDSDGIPWKARFFRLWSEEIGRTELEHFDRAFYDADDALVGKLPKDLSLKETVRRLSAGLARGLSPENGAAAERIASRFCEDSFESLAANGKLLASLAGRYRIGIVSNFYGNLDAICAEAGLAPSIASVIDSARVGAEKPEPRSFQEALSAVGARPDQALFIGDSLARDMAGARSVGMRHAWLAGEGASGAPCCAGDPVLRRLADLEEVLGRN